LGAKGLSGIYTERSNYNRYMTVAVGERAAAASRRLPVTD
jgi:hypothetical protein